MNGEEVQLLGLEIVAFAGDTRSRFLGTLTAVRAGDFAKADVPIEKGNDCIAEAYRAQTNLLTRETQGDDIAYSITMMHDQDHLMTTILLKDLVRYLLEFYKRG